MVVWFSRTWPYIRFGRRKIFISYCRQDGKLVEPIINLLRVAGPVMFRDVDNILPGEKWEESIREAITGCEYLIVIWSRYAALSGWVRSEWQFAGALNKKIVPVLIDNTSLVPGLKEYQNVDLRQLRRASRGGVEVSIGTEKKGVSLGCRDDKYWRWRSYLNILDRVYQAAAARIRAEMAYSRIRRIMGVYSLGDALFMLCLVVVGGVVALSMFDIPIRLTRQ